MLRLIAILFLLPAILLGQDTLNVTLAGSESYWGPAIDIAVVDTVAFLATDGSGLQVVDVSDQSSPVVIGSFQNDLQASKVAASTGIAYVVESLRGVIAVDVSDPNNPIEVTTIAGGALDVAVEGDYLYIAEFASGLRIIDVSNPKLPSEVGVWRDMYNACLVTVQGTFAYVVDDGIGFFIIDISIPSEPRLVGTFLDPEIQDICVSTDRVYVSEIGGNLRIVDISKPADPNPIGLYDGPSKQGYAVKVAGNFAYLVDGRGDVDGMRVIDVSNPALPREVGFYDDPGSAFAIEIVGDRAFIADYSSGLRVIDISSRESPTEVGWVDPPDYAYALSLHGQTAYIIHGGLYSDTHGGVTTVGMMHELRGIEVSDPRQLAEVGSDVLGYCTSYSFSYNVAFNEGHAYMTYAQCGLYVADVSDPPDFDLDYYQNLDWPGKLAVRDHHAFIPTSAGLRVLDVSSPSSPIEVGLFPTTSSVASVFVTDSIAIVIESMSGIHFLSIANPTAPTSVAFMPLVNASGMAVTGQIACVQAYNDVVLIDFANPIVPFEAGRYDPPGTFGPIAADGSYLALTTRETTSDAESRLLRVIDISTPSSPLEVGRHPLQGYPRDICFQNGLVYSAGTTEFSIYDVSAAITSVNPRNELSKNYTLHPIYPNPFNNTANIALDLPREVTGRLVAYDVLGREAAEIYNGRLVAGAHVMQFDGANLPSGIYFVRLETPQFTAIQKAVLLK